MTENISEMYEKYISVSDDEYSYILDTTMEDFKTLDDFEQMEFEKFEKDGEDIKLCEDDILQKASDKYWDWVFDNYMACYHVVELLNEQNDKLETINKIINWVYKDYSKPPSACLSDALSDIRDILDGGDLK